MSNALINSSIITNEALRVLENSLTFANQINREYDDKFAVEGAKIGDTLNIRKPARYVGRSGATLTVEDHVETSVPLVLSTQFGVDVNFTSADLTLKIDKFADRIIKPAMATIANKIDLDGTALYKNIYNAVGTPGTTPATLRVFLDAGAKMDYEATPRDGQRSVVIDPVCQASMVDTLKGLFQSSTEIGKQYKSGQMGQSVGLDWYMDQNITTHTVGPLGGTPLVNGVPAQGATTLVTDGWTAAAASRLKAGDIFTIANVYAVNPQSRQSTGQLRQFVVTADVSSDGSGNLTAAISPAIQSTGAFATVNALPVDNAAITVLGAASTVSPANMAFHKDFCVLASADLLMPKGVDMASRASSKSAGLSIRMVRAYDINNDKFPTRFDVLYGYKVVYPELACRIMG
jgi:hypothetical protein